VLLVLLVLLLLLLLFFVFIDLNNHLHGRIRRCLLLRAGNGHLNPSKLNARLAELGQGTHQLMPHLDGLGRFFRTPQRRQKRRHAQIRPTARDQAP
jgi:hypothetical protein